ncbi:hypothetical protein [Paenibacillus bovis]|uniref:Uncharacterized protein n=1 Tax=Paenibacillus bovis TaxID=1616788 RepID=A0A172ZDV1_9BACL|nr:hypothetical protein [Paenibacillus bovis]ANF95709.1 hypothetical protein AR543_06645 [Paenibacillus bovis]
MVKWIGRLIGTALILSLVISMNSTIMHAEQSNIVGSESLSPQAVLGQSIKAVKIADPKGKLNTASYQVQFAKDSKDFFSIHSMSPDRSGEHLIIMYQTEDEFFASVKDKRQGFRIASIQVKNGKKVWETVIQNERPHDGVYGVESNGEMFVAGEDKDTFYLHTINEKTGKMTRTIKQPHPAASTFMLWDYWLMNNNQLVVSYAINNKSTLRYFDPAGKLLNTRTLSGTVWDAEADHIVVTDGNALRYTLSVQDHKGNATFKKSIVNKDYSLFVYLLPDLSVAVESGMPTPKGYACRLTKYDAKGKKQWQHAITGPDFPYYEKGNHLMAVHKSSNKVFFLNDQGKETHPLAGNGTINLAAKEIYFEGQTTRIADAQTMKWLAELQYQGEKPRVAWLGKQQLAVYDTKNSVIAAIRIKG